MGVQRSKLASANPFSRVSGKCRLENESSVRWDSDIEWVAFRVIVMRVQDAESGGLQIEMAPVLIASTERIHPHPPRPDYRHHAPRQTYPPRVRVSTPLGM